MSKNKPPMNAVKLSAPSEPPRPPEPPVKASGFTKFFFLRTVFGILLTVLIVVGGLLGYGSMIKESNPDIAVAIASVTTTLGRRRSRNYRATGHQ